MKRFFCLVGIVFLSFGFSASQTHALSSDVRAVATTSLYGAAAGTVLGLASYPFSKSVRGIFIGTSIGLYLGLVIGIYHIWNIENPENPLSPHYGLQRDNSPFDLLVLQEKDIMAEVKVPLLGF